MFLQTVAGVVDPQEVGAATAAVDREQADDLVERAERVRRQRADLDEVVPSPVETRWVPIVSEPSPRTVVTLSVVLT